MSLRGAQEQQGSISVPSHPLSTSSTANKQAGQTPPGRAHRIATEKGNLKFHANKSFPTFKGPRWL